MPRKRQAHYTLRIGKEICERIALGDTVRQALKHVDMGAGRAPSIQGLYNWFESFPEFREMYERARIIQADLLADRVQDMATEVLAEPNKANAYKVSADILKWQAEVRNPKRYAPRIAHDVTMTGTLDPKRLTEEIKRLEKDLGMAQIIENPLPTPEEPPDEDAKPE